MRKLGPMLVQLPPSLEFDDSVATKFLALFRKYSFGAVVWNRVTLVVGLSMWCHQKSR